MKPPMNLWDVSVKTCATHVRFWGLDLMLVQSLGHFLY
jgi:hypothetical protein